MRIVLFFIMMAFVGCVSRRVDYFGDYFSDGVGRVYGKFYKEKIISSEDSFPEVQYIQILRRAYRGDLLALDEFFHSPNRYADGEKGISWVYDCLFLLISIGDQKFAKVLSSEDEETKRLVGFALEAHVHWQNHSFSKTRAIYWSPYMNGKQ